jgi:hypothetical protein
MPQKLISRADLARMRGVSRAAVTQALRSKLAPALHGQLVDASHPVVKAWLGAADGAATASPKPAKAPPPTPTKPTRTAKNAAPQPPAVRPELPPEEPAPSDDELDAFAELLRPLVTRFGTSRAFALWLAAADKLEVIRERRLKNEEAEGKLISRDLVKTHVLGAVEAGNRRLLNDSPKTIARRIYAAAKAGEPVESAEQVVREIIESHLGPVKTTAVRLLREP